MRQTQRTSTPDQFKQAIANASDVPDVLAAIIFGKRQELCTYLTQRVFRQATDQVLLDYNFNVETVISSDSYAQVNE